MIHKNNKKVYKDTCVLCFDYGTKYIGIAIGCLETKIITTLTTLCLKKKIQETDCVLKICNKYNIVTIVLGTSSKKTCPEIQKKINIFKKNLLIYNIPIYFEDEILTTKLCTKNFNTKTNKICTHSISAYLILQMWLNKKKCYY